ncbi:unnamed protein product [Ceutorhynchus assimilis]|uniref:Uncharacterized protein n=1 Tax=Ceutorhynchus assimilis TaxID=467358 RepID=A0A9P0GRF7_9CUCU|nr:unnamed protein product [Ceutorhynchus assimilis]
MKTIFLALAFLGYTQCAKLDHLKYLPPNSRPASSESFDQGLAAPDSNGPQLVDRSTNSHHSSPSGFGGHSGSSSQPSHVSNFGPSGYSNPQPSHHGPSQVAPDSNTAGSSSQSSFSPNQPAPSSYGKTDYYSQQKYQPSAPQNQIPIIKLETTNNGDGSYSTAYETGNGIQAAEQGEKIDLSYTADENGYHPHGDNLPTPPPVPDAILKSIEYNKAHPEEENDDGSYKADSQGHSSSSRQYLSPKPVNSAFHGLASSQFGPSKNLDSNVAPSQYSSQFSGSPNQAPSASSHGSISGYGSHAAASPQAQSNGQNPSSQYSPQASSKAQNPSAFSHGYSAPHTSGSSSHGSAPENSDSSVSPTSVSGQYSHSNIQPQVNSVGNQGYQYNAPSTASQYSPQTPTAFSHGSAPVSQTPSASHVSSGSPSSVSGQYSSQASSNAQNPSAFSHGSTNGYSASKSSDSSVSPTSVSGQYSHSNHQTQGYQYNAPSTPSQYSPAQTPSAFSHGSSTNSAPSASHVSSGSPSSISGQYSPQASSNAQNPSAFSHGSTNGYSASKSSDSSVSPTSVSGQYSHSNIQPQGYQHNAPSTGFGASGTGAGEFGPGFAGNHVNPSKVAGVQAQDANGAYIY